MMLAWCGYLTYIACNDEDKMQQGNRLPVEGVGDKYVIVARHRDRSSGQWGNPRYISYSPGPGNLTPTVGYDNGDYRLIWKIKNQDKLARLDYIAGQGWQSDGQIQLYTGSGIQTPSISGFYAGSRNSTAAVWSVNQTAPFAIVYQPISSTPENSDPGTVEKETEGFTGIEANRQGIFNLSEIIPGLKGTLRIQLHRVEEVSQARQIPFPPESQDFLGFMGSSGFTPLPNASQFKLRIGIHGHEVEINQAARQGSWEIFRAVLREASSTAGPGKGKILKTIRLYHWEELVNEINSGDFSIEKEFDLNLSRWNGSIVQVEVELLKNLPVEPLYIEEILLNEPLGENLAPLAKSGGENENNSEPVGEYALYPAYPNPFNPSTIIAFDLPETQHVKLEVFDVSGRKLLTLVDQTMNAGRHQVSWDGKDPHGNPASSGVYLYQLKAGGQRLVKKMMLIR